MNSLRSFNASPIPLKKQLIKIVLFSSLFGVVLLSESIYYYYSISIYDYLRHNAQKSIMLSEMQIKQIVPALLIEEEFGSINLYLEDIKENEDLVSAEFMKNLSSTISKDRECDCYSYNKLNTVCIDKKNLVVTIATEVNYWNKHYGYLVKQNKVNIEGIESSFFNFITILSASILLPIVLMILWITFFIKTYIDLPLTNLSQVLVPILKNGELVPYKPFKLKELDDIAKQLITIVTKYEKKIKEQSKLYAIVKTTQMLAHDVRKPFSMLDGLLTIFKSADTVPEMQKIIKHYIPEVKRALTSVDIMINDVMEVGRNSQPVKKPVSPECIIEASLKEVCHMHRKAKIDIHYDFTHNYMINVDRHRIQRVFSNIINNAFEAMVDHHGIRSLWFRSHEDLNSGFITFSIGNSGSSIHEDEISKLFNAFYTKNKQGGTGLGLAIAQEVINAHGGEIWCTSSNVNKTVVFFFSLPMDKATRNVKTARLPSNTESMIKRFELSKIEKDEISRDEDEALNENRKLIIQSYEKAIIEKANKRAKPFAIGIADDERLYRNTLNDIIIRSKEMEKVIDIYHFQNSHSVLKACETDLLDILICDVDLGQNSLNGFDLVKEIRKKGITIPICIHSNRSSFDQYEQAVKVGAQAFIAKPVIRARILKFITNSIYDDKALLSN